jgi:hypothetical protein
MSGVRVGPSEEGVPRFGGGGGLGERVPGERPPVSAVGGPSSGRVLNGMDRVPRTIVFILYEEEVNMFPGMAFYGRMFTESEVSVRALEHRAEAPFPMRATIDVAGRWRLMGFSLSHVLLFCFRQCFGE